MDNKNSKANILKKQQKLMQQMPPPSGWESFQKEGMQVREGDGAGTEHVVTKENLFQEMKRLQGFLND